MNELGGGKGAEMNWFRPTPFLVLNLSSHPIFRALLLCGSNLSKFVSIAAPLSHIPLRYIDAPPLDQPDRANDFLDQRRLPYPPNACPDNLYVCSPSTKCYEITRSGV